jgi:hypothetical protein
MPRHSSRSQESAAEGEESRDSDPPTHQPENEIPPNPPVAALSIRQQHRAVAEREASRLARPERRNAGPIGHASISKSAVTSTPFGISTGRPPTIDDRKEEWCGPFSVARQVRFSIHISKYLLS